MKELPKTYNPKGVEDEIYKRWEASGFFNPDNLEKAADRYWKAEPFSIAMPPANVTAELHLGSAMFLTIEDLMIRHARMTGKKTLWLPGTDHAAIATQNVVERQLWEKEKKTRHDIGREELLRRIQEFIKTTQGRIQVQIRKIGSSCDWSREKYTLSPELSLAVRTVFKKMYDAGLIYRGDRIVNWCPRCGTTLADDEVEYKPVAGKLYYVRYPLNKGGGTLTVATTRPETLLGDTALAVNPKDSRYQKYVGQTVMLPVLNRELPVIADPAVDREFGTGVLKVTPGHDPNDFEIGKHHQLEIINLFTSEGKINEREAFDHGFEDYANLTVSQAREKITKALTDGGFLQKTEDITHNVGFCYRCATIVEPLISKQWFINVNQKLNIKNQNFRKLLQINEQASLKEIATAAVNSGAIKIIPERFVKVYLNWMENLRDWNISRQIWFGHRIPVWYCEECQQTIVEVETPTLCPQCRSTKLSQDPDTLDTWFSSSLWTFSTLGWPKETEDLKIFHPTSILETGYDILFFWVARMIIMTGFVLEDVPFRHVYLHGLVRDFEGKKMSKSRGNAVNPLEIIENYGTDALRLSLILGTTPGNDTKISEEKIQNYRNFVNKLWNISRFILSYATDVRKPPLKAGEKEMLKSQTLSDQWILAELQNLIAKVQKNFNSYQYGQAGELLLDFTWNKFADWYLEISKIEKNKQEVLLYILPQLLKLWHPFIPFVTEHLWSQFSKELLMIQEYPSPAPTSKRNLGGQAIAKFSMLQALITGLRNLRSEYRQEPAEIFACYVADPKPELWLAEQVPNIEKLARVKVNFEAIPGDKKMPYFLWENTRVYLIIPDFDPQKEEHLTEKELEETAVVAEKLNAQLKKKDFLEKAPAEVVAKIRADFEVLKDRQEKLEAKLQQLR